MFSLRQGFSETASALAILAGAAAASTLPGAATLACSVLLKGSIGVRVLSEGLITGCSGGGFQRCSSSTSGRGVGSGELLQAGGVPPSGVEALSARQLMLGVTV